MKIQVITDSAVRVLQYLHEQNNKELHTAMSIAEAIGIPYPNFIKIAGRLKEHNLVNPIPGRSGGYMLGRPAHEISLYDVFLAIEGGLVINPCLNGQPCKRGKHRDCRLHSALRDLQGKIATELSSLTIADLVS